jgi:putative hydrolase of the HAD superfamily
MTNAIIFDLDDTLIEDHAATQKAFAQVTKYAQAQHGVEAQKLADDTYRHACEIWHNSAIHPYCDFLGISVSEGLWGTFADASGHDTQLQVLHRWAPAYRRESWLRGLAEQGVRDQAFAGELAEMFREVRRNSADVFDDVVLVLEELSKSYRLAMLTNGASDLQREKIVRSGLERYFDVIVVSGEAGMGKPDPEVFSQILKRLSLLADAAVMVGDSLPRDIQGAHNSKMRGIWINRLGRICTKQYAPMVYAHMTNLHLLHSVL